MIDRARAHAMKQVNAPPTVDTFVIDPEHSEIVVSIRHMLTRAQARFRSFRGTFVLDRVAPEQSSVLIVVEAASIDTGHAWSDAHARSGEFLDVARHPEIAFQSDRVRQLSYYRYLVTGGLTLRGITQVVTLLMFFIEPLRDPWGRERAGLSTEFELNRNEFGMAWNMGLDGGGFVLGDWVRVAVDLDAVHQTDPHAA